MGARALVFVLALAAAGCGGGEDRSCGDMWKVLVTDDPAPLTPAPDEPVLRLDVRETMKCVRALEAGNFSVELFGPNGVQGKSTQAMFPENLLLMEHVDDGDGRLGKGDALLLTEGFAAEVPPGIEWLVGLFEEDDDGQGGSGVGSAEVLLE